MQGNRVTWLGLGTGFGECEMPAYSLSDCFEDSEDLRVGILRQYIGNCDENPTIP